MKKRHLVLILVLVVLITISCNFVSGVFSSEPDFYFHIRSEDGNGIIDCDGEWIIEPDDDLFFVNGMSEGLVPVQDFDENIIYYINRDGEDVFNKTFDHANLFIDGYAAVQVDDKWGFIDTSGEYIIRPTYETYTIGQFGSGLVNVPEDKNAVGYPDAFIFINEDGDEVLGPYRWASPFLNGYAAVSEKRGDDYEDIYSGFIQPDGEFALEFDFESKLGAVQLSAGEGLFGVHDIRMEIEEGKCSTGFMDENAEWVIDPQFCDVTAFNDGYAAVSVRGDDGDFLMGYIDTEGNYLVEPEYDYATNFMGGCAVVFWDQFASVGLIDTQGEFIYEYER